MWRALSFSLRFGSILHIPSGLSATALVLAVFSGCHGRPDYGKLRITGPSEGTYDVYRIASEAPLQFVSEQIGRFNADLDLLPGSYLVLADCSSETVIITPGLTKTLAAHRAVFLPPFAPQPTDRFSIQCERSAKTRSRQHIVNRYGLNVLEGNREILVGLEPVTIDFGDDQKTEVSKTVSHRLSAIKVQADSRQEAADGIPYFISADRELIASTESQLSGHWLFLLPGRYRVELNGTSTTVELSEGESRTIQPAFLNVETSEKVDLDLSSQIRGTPLFLELNNGRWMNLNQSYPVLPGTLTLQLNGSSHGVLIDLVEGEVKNLKARSLKIDLGCSPWEWSCLGDKKVSLYLPSEPYQFVEGVSDVPILFLEDEVLVGIEGSRDIRYRLKPGARDSVLQVGHIEIVPKQVYVKGQITDLMRVESEGAMSTGNTLDIALDNTTKMPLVAGTYSLTEYVMSTTVDGDRRRSAQRFYVAPGQTLTLGVTVYLSEKRMLALKKQQEEQAVIKSQRGRPSGQYMPATPLEIF